MTYIMLYKITWWHVILYFAQRICFPIHSSHKGLILLSILRWHLVLCWNNLVGFRCLSRRHDTQHNGIMHNNEFQHNDIRYNHKWNEKLSINDNQHNLIIITTLIITTPNITTLSIMTLSITTFSIMTHDTECCYAKCYFYWVWFMLSFANKLFKLSVIILNV